MKSRSHQQKAILFVIGILAALFATANLPMRGIDHSLSARAGTDMIRTDDPTDISCPKGPVGPIYVEFSRASVDIYSPCKDISNVVLLFCDASHYKFSNLTGYSYYASGVGDNQGAPIAGVWVKAGNNRSGDGPGYGQFFASPLSCPSEEPPEEPPP
jgi:hypothetical protein